MKARERRSRKKSRKGGGGRRRAREWQELPQTTRLWKRLRRLSFGESVVLPTPWLRTGGIQSCGVHFCHEPLTLLWQLCKLSQPRNTSTVSLLAESSWDSLHCSPRHFSHSCRGYWPVPGTAWVVVPLLSCFLPSPVSFYGPMKTLFIKAFFVV